MIQKESKEWFEGWYYKIDTEHCSFAIIVGYSITKQESYAFIQTIDTLTHKTQYLKFDIGELNVKQKPFHIKLQDNHFYHDGMLLNIDQPIQMKGRLIFENPILLSATQYAPNIMGPFSYLKHMQCIHDIISLHHHVTGEIQIQKHQMYINGTGYMEKDSGTSFPKKYLWLQSNRCNYENSCFFLAAAHIPLKFIHFQGIICTLMVGKEQLQFASYYGARFRILSKEKKETESIYSMVITQYPYQLYIKVYQPSAYPLLAPNHGEMKGTIYEGLEGRILLRLYHHHDLVKRIVFHHAGCEFHEM